MARSCLIRRGFPNRSVCLGYLRRPTCRVRRMRNPLGKAKIRLSTNKNIMASAATTLVMAGLEMRALHQDTAIPRMDSGMAARTGGESNRPARRVQNLARWLSVTAVTRSALSLSVSASRKSLGNSDNPSVLRTEEVGWPLHHSSDTCSDHA